MDIVDAHHHIWRQSDLPWLQGDMQPRIFGAYESIMRDYPVEEFVTDVAAHGITQSVYVQANWPTDAFVEEVEWVSAQAERSGWPHGISGYADFSAGDVRGQLDRLAGFSLMRGVRQQFHWHENPLYRFVSDPMLPADPVVVRNIRHLADHDWVFELQVFSSQMDCALSLVEQCPDVNFVLQHAGMPEDLSATGRELWEQGTQRLAEAPNVYCKLSGLGTFLRSNDPVHIRDIVNQSIDWFGPGRCLFGSNFPIEKIWTPYAALVDAYRMAVSHRALDDQVAIFSGTARSLYRLNKT